MSHTIIIDESNGNGIFNVKQTGTTTTNMLAPSISNEDLSQSLSEYTDAEESMSAPTEFLAEFLSAVMLKDYRNALKYCKLILQYEPNNATAKEFYPLIQEKLKYDYSSESDENYNKSSSPEVIDNSPSMGTGAQTGSDHSGSQNGSDIEDMASTSDSDENNLDESPLNVSSTSTNSRSDNTTHSYSSLLLEEDDDVPPQKRSISPNLDFSNGNYQSASCSDSESPTEPLTQRIVAILRAKCVPGKTTDN